MSSSSPSRSPHRSRAEHSNGGEERPRFFDKMVKNLCWAKAKVDLVDTQKDGAKTLLGTQSVSVSATAMTVSASSTITSFHSLKVVNPQRIIAKYFKQESTDKELDVIEMAVYGDVIRPGNHCRCKTVAENLGHFKPKDRTPACQLPYDQESPL